MPSLALPSINVQACQTWSENDREMYNSLPFYFAKMAVEHRKTWSIWSKLLGKRKWTPNMGPTMRLIQKEPSPHLRQFAFPNAVCDSPKKDIIGVRERTVDAAIRLHQFESPVFNFCPSFQDFLTDHIDYTLKDILDKQTRFEDLFYRGHIFHQSPNVFFPDRVGGELVVAPTGDGNDAGTSGKTLAWLAANLSQIGSPGNLSLNAINLATTTMSTDLRVPPFSGAGLPQGDDNPLSGKYVLALSEEAWNQFIYDPWFSANKNINLDIVFKPFQGSLFGRVTCKIEDMPIRFDVSGTGEVTIPDVEEICLTPTDVNYNQSIPSQAYINAEYEVAFLVGGNKPYSYIDVGAPPKYFGGNLAPEGFGNMRWNGEIQMTKDLLVPCPTTVGQGTDQFTWDTNKYGKYLQLISEVTYAIVGEQKRNILPIPFKRRRGANGS